MRMLKLEHASRQSVPHPALYLVGGAQMIVPVGLPGDHCQDVQDEGGGPLPQQQEAPVLPGLQPGRPKAQGLVHRAGVVQQPAHMWEELLTLALVCSWPAFSQAAWEPRAQTAALQQPAD